MISTPPSTDSGPSPVRAGRTTPSVECDVRLDPASWLDEHGVLLREDDQEWVYRALTDKGEAVLRHIEAGPGLAKLGGLGLVETERVENPRSLPHRPELKTMVRHRRIQPVVYPTEWTPVMWQEALAFLCRFMEGLASHGLALADAHAFNILFTPQGRPVFIDFGSLRVARRRFAVSRSWHRELRRDFLLPLLLQKLGCRQLASAVACEPATSFVKQHYRFSPLLLPTVAFDALYELARLFRRPGLYLRGVEVALCGKRLAPDQTSWTNYAATGEGWKGDFVRSLLEQITDASSVLDLAGNKGTYALFAAKLGKRTLLADIDAASLDQARATAQRDGIPLLVALTDLCYPTPPRGLGLLRPSPYERFQSDLVMALAVSHHLAFRRKVPFHTFAEIISRFARRYILTEFVGLGDEHVIKWLNKGRQPPSGYSDDQFTQAFADAGWRVVKRSVRPDGHRSLYLFERRSD